ncbi:hypothetical protein GG344DRAFT_34365, partial [Lentinula edodes]
ISPYHSDLSCITNIPPKHFRAANKQHFSADKRGELSVDLPNGVDDPSKLHLTEVLYSPEVGYTLISIGKLDEAGFEVTFGDGKCTI